MYGRGYKGKFWVGNHLIGKEAFGGLDHPLEILAFLTCETLEDEDAYDEFVGTDGDVIGNTGESGAYDNYAAEREAYRHFDD